jgi:transitional endoplasmic reticulum ATPase
MAPPVLFIDELDVVAPARSGNSSDIYGEEIVGQLLQEMDGILRENSHTFILAATNDKDAIDSAILS